MLLFGEAAQFGIGTDGVEAGLIELEEPVLDSQSRSHAASCEFGFSVCGKCCIGFEELRVFSDAVLDQSITYEIYGWIRRGRLC